MQPIDKLIRPSYALIDTKNERTAVDAGKSQKGSFHAISECF